MTGNASAPSVPALDYRELLGKYMLLIVKEEGIHFLREGDAYWSEIELQELFTIAREKLEIAGGSGG